MSDKPPECHVCRKPNADADMLFASGDGAMSRRKIPDNEM